ncbi:hypothetical protein DNL40_13505 [Xylanimonas oleitrophica]|uniref:DUF8094 domain-containing protein n=1 Tax=Xylanimonas oleitrophica TaxID=2607479 RepID=A0A2W5WLG4_9MICO|nr:hypothetical protein [Xylanimonas oleitrophica]PZR52030.1 hypothetical protein DNL40_13505 [Xylanimonas oleitrophica]
MTAHPFRRTRPAARTAALGVLAALALAGCAEDVPTPNPDAAATGPALSADQENRVLEAMNTTLAQASESGDAGVLDQRLTGPALAVRTSQLRVAQLRGNADLVTNLQTEYQALIVPASDTWPRTAFAVTEAGEDLQAPRLLALEQASAREPYKLWGWVQLRPGVTLPSFAAPELGSEELAPDDASLLVSPQDVAGQYAELATSGDESPFAPTFESSDEDLFRKFLKENVQAQTQELQKDGANGSYSYSVALTPDTPVKAVRTADGGGMVMVSLDMVETMEAPAGVKVAPPEGRSGEALLEGAAPTNKLVNGYSDMVALYVPPQGSDQTVKLLGWTHVQTSVSQ